LGVKGIELAIGLNLINLLCSRNL